MSQPVRSAHLPRWCCAELASPLPGRGHYTLFSASIIAIIIIDIDYINIDNSHALFSAPYLTCPSDELFLFYSGCAELAPPLPPPPPRPTVNEVRPISIRFGPSPRWVLCRASHPPPLIALCPMIHDRHRAHLHNVLAKLVARVHPSFCRYPADLGSGPMVVALPQQLFVGGCASTQWGLSVGICGPGSPP